MIPSVTIAPALKVVKQSEPEYDDGSIGNMLPYPAVLPKENVDYPGSSSLKIDEKTGKTKYFKPASN